MRTLFIHAGPHVPGMLIATLLGVATSLSGCAVKPTSAYGMPASGCGFNAVLYCDLGPLAERCECVRHSEVRDVASSLWRR
jgi:hypothetical protein